MAVLLHLLIRSLADPVCSDREQTAALAHWDDTVTEATGGTLSVLITPSTPVRGQDQVETGSATKSPRIKTCCKPQRARFLQSVPLHSSRKPSLTHIVPSTAEQTQ